MYSYEDRLRAVKLYLKLGRRMSATLRQLGYPSKNSLKAWCAQFDQSRDLRRGYPQIKRRYTDEQKHRAVDHYIEYGHSLIYTIRCLGYPGRETLRTWIGELRPETRKTITGSTTPHNMPRSRATKQHAIVALNTRSGSAREVADTIGVTRETLYSWHHQLLGYSPLKPMPKKTDTALLEQQRADLLRELTDLEVRVRKLRLEHDILEKASELIKKDMGINLLGLTNREKTMVVDALKDCYPLNQLLQSLKLARSTYFYQRLRQTFPDKYGQVRATIRSLFDENYRCYGYRRIDGALRRQGVCLSEKVVRRLMAQESLVVAWSIGTHPDANLVNTMLDQAVQTLRPDEHPVIHADRGAHYRWPEWIRRTANAKLVRSMSKKGCSPDNAACEGFFGRLKTELIYPETWRDVTLEDCMMRIDGYIRWYNERRIKLSLGRRSPVEYRNALGLKAL